jgi:predicted nucleotidyltransferase
VGELSDRRNQTAARLSDIQARLNTAGAYAAGKACVYVTGSYGRGEASPHSDLDLFIVGKGTGRQNRDGKPGSQLSRLDEVCIKAELIQVTRDLHIQEFSGDGQWLDHYSVDELTQMLGTQHDDAQNTFTARLLLLLESKPIVEAAVYEAILGDVIAAYWRDYEDHRDNFIPAFLTNDILRLWRTFCVNYEERTVRVPELQKAKGKLKNYKLKHSRLLTCYSAILYLLAVYNKNSSVHPQDVQAMIQLTPTERLEWLRNQPDLESAYPSLDALLVQYDIFLVSTNAPEGEIIDRFMDKERSRIYLEASGKFGDSLRDALDSIGQRSRYHRLIVV